MAQAENRNPGKRGHASGADRKTSCAQDTAGATGAQSARDPFAVAKDEFLDRVACTDFGNNSAAPRVAIKLVVGYASRAEYDGKGHLLAWPSIKRMARELGMYAGRVIRAVEALEDTGLLTVDRSARNHRYTLHAAPLTGTQESRERAEKVLSTVCNQNGEKVLGTENLQTPEKVLGAENARFQEPRTKSLRDTPDVGGRAFTRVPADTQDDVLCDADDGAAMILNGRAPEGAPVMSEAELMAELSLLPDHLTDADAGDVVQDGEPVTLADLDRIEAEERAAVVALAFPPSDPEADPVAEAADDWAALHGAALDDAEGFALDVLDGFPRDLGDPDAATRAATTCAKMLLACGSRPAALSIWNEHLRIMRGLMAAVSIHPARVPVAVSDYRAAVGKAADDLRARRPAANSETVTLGAAADV